jgi:hypothetical protein
MSDREGKVANPQDSIEGLTMNRFEDNQEITCSEEGALILIADACGLNAPAPANVWELILLCLRKSPQMRLSSLAFALSEFATSEPKPMDHITIGEIQDRCREVVRKIDEDFLRRN